jgi:hypothetical protein
VQCQELARCIANQAEAIANYQGNTAFNPYAAAQLLQTNADTLAIWMAARREADSEEKQMTTNLDPNSRQARTHRDRLLHDILRGAAPVPPEVWAAKPAGDPNIYAIRLLVGMDRGEPARETFRGAVRALRFWPDHKLLFFLAEYGAEAEDTVRVDILQGIASDTMAHAIAVREIGIREAGA